MTVTVSYADVDEEDERGVGGRGVSETTYMRGPSNQITAKQSTQSGRGSRRGGAPHHVVLSGKCSNTGFVFSSCSNFH